MDIAELESKRLTELREIARDLDVSGFSAMKKQQLVYEIMRTEARKKGLEFRGGVLEIIEDDKQPMGFLRADRNYHPTSDDIYVSNSQIRRLGLRTGDMIIGQVREPKDNEKYHSLLRVEAVNGLDPETARRRPRFEKLTPIFPEEKIKLETKPHILSTRLLDLVAPIGRGQRGLIVSPPKAGKTTVLKEIANGISENYADIYMIVALIGERPEEVTDMERSVEGEVVSSTFDEPVKNHCAVAEMALERAKRLVEAGKDVVILLDSITRLARAYNLTVAPSGRTLSGGLDPTALYPPKRFFGAARKVENGGSLTILATAMVETGSRTDEVILEEFAGTGNMELHLSREMADKRIFPALDIQQSSTLHEEQLLSPDELEVTWSIRRALTGDAQHALESVLERISSTSSNEEFHASVRANPIAPAAAR